MSYITPEGVKFTTSRPIHYQKAALLAKKILRAENEVSFKPILQISPVSQYAMATVTFVQETYAAALGKFFETREKRRRHG